MSASWIHFEVQDTACFSLVFLQIRESRVFRKVFEQSLFLSFLQIWCWANAASALGLAAGLRSRAEWGRGGKWLLASGLLGPRHRARSAKGHICRFNLLPNESGQWMSNHIFEVWVHPPLEPSPPAERIFRILGRAVLLLLHGGSGQVPNCNVGKRICRWLI